MAKTLFTLELLTAIRNQEWREHELDLSDQELKPQEVIALAGALGRNPFIKSLNLRRCKIDDIGTQALAGNKTLTTLDVSGNAIGDGGAKALADNKTLTTLDMSGNAIGDASAQTLADNKTLTTLYVSWNKISDAGTQALAANKTLTALNVGVNEIGDAGAQALAANRTLTTLDVTDNKIDEDLQQQLALVSAQNRKRSANQAGLAVAVACYRANLRAEATGIPGAITKLIPVIHDYAGFQQPAVAMGEVMGKNFFKELVYIPPSPAHQQGVEDASIPLPRARCQQ